MVYFTVVGDPRLADLLKFLLSELAQTECFSLSNRMKGSASCALAAGDEN
jgi:hypothetical protein